MLFEKIDSQIDEKRIAESHNNWIDASSPIYPHYLRQLAAVMKTLEDRLAECKDDAGVSALIRSPSYGKFLLADKVVCAIDQSDRNRAIELCEETQEHQIIINTSTPLQLLGHAYTFFISHAKRDNSALSLHPIRAEVTAAELNDLESAFCKLSIDEYYSLTVQDTAATSLNFLMNLSLYTRTKFEFTYDSSDFSDPSKSLPKEESKFTLIAFSIVVLILATAYHIFQKTQPANSPKPG